MLRATLARSRTQTPDPRCPFYHLVPKDPAANLAFRRALIEYGHASRENARTLWLMCSRDMLFYTNAFVWTYDPRREGCPAVPFITYPFQDAALLELDDCIGQRDVLIEKSRDMGASWICLLVFEWRWHFKVLQSFLLVSRKEDLVDKTADPKSLFWKLDFIHQHLPRWLLPTYSRQKMHLHNEDNGSTVDGESTGSETARGDRRTGILLDEFASVENGYEMLAATADATNSRIFNSTPKGTGNAFYDVAQSEVRKLRFHWSIHPEKARGLYYDTGGQPRSPWYDAECRRRSHPMEIAQELDIDYLGSDYAFFDPAVLERIQRDEVRPAYRTGQLEFDTDTAEPLRWADGSGPIHLWTLLDGPGRPANDREYVVGVDVATGTTDASGKGASNSVISVGDRQTGEKVLEYAAAGISPYELAKLAVAICKWFQGPRAAGALLIWEANGPGRLFGDRVIDLGYRHVYYRANERSLSHKVTDTPGWYSTRENKLALIGEYRRALNESAFKNRSFEAIRECRFYVFTPAGGVAHSRSVNTVDPTGARENHGDRVVADALVWKGLKESTPARVERPPGFLGSFFERRRDARRRRREAN